MINAMDKPQLPVNRSTQICLAVLFFTVPVQADTIYVSNFGNNTISKIAFDGKVQTFASGFASPYGIAFDGSGYLYAANGNTTNFQRVSLSGAVSRFAILPRGYGATAIAFDANGYLYVANQNPDSLTNPKATILRISRTGTTSVFFSGAAPSFGAAFDAGGNLYLSHLNLNRISRITTNGTASYFATSGLSGPWGLAFDAGGTLYVANWNNGSISRISPAGQVSSFVGGFGLPVGLAFGLDGTLYVADQAANTVTKVTPAGQKSLLASGLSTPLFIAVEPDPAVRLSLAPQNGQEIIQNGLRLDVSGGIMMYYEIRASSDFISWDPIAVLQVIATNQAQILDLGAQTQPFRFYRARLLP
jgi:sugar lactone lactonase YvrE